MRKPNSSGELNARFAVPVGGSDMGRPVPDHQLLVGELMTHPLAIGGEHVRRERMASELQDLGGFDRLGEALVTRGRDLRIVKIEPVAELVQK